MTQADLEADLASSCMPYGPHTFTIFGSDRYQARADRLSWEALQDFLATNLSE
jgi:dienelactone hydrolase